MAEQKEPQVSIHQVRYELRSAKEKLSGQARTLSVKECLGKHPYISLGVAFFAGAVLGGFRSVRVEIARTILSVVSKELTHRK